VKFKYTIIVLAQSDEVGAASPTSMVLAEINNEEVMRTVKQAVCQALENQNGK
jgi:hypothetical protein